MKSAVSTALHFVSPSKGLESSPVSNIRLLVIPPPILIPTDDGIS